MNRGGRSSQLHWRTVSRNDVLYGRGISISQHAGNERFRALVFARKDPEYCTSYSTAEKRALAEEIISHIKSLTPPGRFLRRPEKYTKQSGTGLDGPWEEVPHAEIVKKTCQALRDCNRKDRDGYGVSVANVPEDVLVSTKDRSKLGMTQKQLAEQAAKKALLNAESTGSISSAFSLVSPSSRIYTTPTSTSVAAAAPSKPQAPGYFKSTVAPDMILSGSKRKTPDYALADPLRSRTPPVYEPVERQQPQHLPEITPGSPSGLSSGDFCSDQLIASYVATAEDVRGPFNHQSAEDDLVAALEDSKPRADDNYLDDFDGHEALPGVIHDSPPSSPLLGHPPPFP